MPIVLPFNGSFESASEPGVTPADGDEVASAAGETPAIASKLVDPSRRQILLIDPFCFRFPLLLRRYSLNRGTNGSVATWISGINGVGMVRDNFGCYLKWRTTDYFC